jgi:uncharacterized protein (TIGR00369 family)
VHLDERPEARLLCVLSPQPEQPMNQSLFDFVRDNIAATPFHRWLLPELTQIDEGTGSVTIRLRLRAELTHTEGGSDAHGGVVAALIDIAGHAAVCARVGRSVPTIDMRVDYLSPAGGTALDAVATLVKMGRLIALVDIRVTDDQGRLAAVGRASYLAAAS